MGAKAVVTAVIDTESSILPLAYDDIKFEHSLNIRPLVVLDDSKIDVKILSRNGNYLLSVDGRSQVLSQDIQLHIERSQRTIKLVRIDGQTFMQSLKDKLNWGK